MSAATFFGMTVLLTDPEDVILAIENEGSLQTLTSSSTGLEQASETSLRIFNSVSVFGRTLSSSRQLETDQIIMRAHKNLAL